MLAHDVDHFWSAKNRRLILPYLAHRAASVVICTDVIPMDLRKQNSNNACSTLIAADDLLSIDRMKLAVDHWMMRE